MKTMSIKRKGLTLEVFEDTYDDPREYYQDTNLTKMICFHRKYKLGDEHNFSSPNEFDEWYKKNEDKVACIMPLYLLDHSGLYMSTHDFQDPWDSGQVGYVYILKETLREHNMDNEIASYDICRAMIDEEVEEYSSWLCGIPPYYSFTITDENDNVIESMGIFELTSKKEMFNEMKDRSNHKYDFIFDALLEREKAEVM